MRSEASQQGGLIRGAYETLAAQQVGASQFAHGTQEVAQEVEVQPGHYTLIPCTFEAGREASFALSLYSSTPGALAPPVALVGGQAVKAENVGKSGQVARPQGPAGPPGGGKNRMAPPAAKYDVGEARRAEAAYRAQQGGGGGETEDDGKMGYAERMELEEAIRLEKWKENVPMMTIEGQPLSKTVKKWAQDLIDGALAQCRQTGQKFEDAGFPQHPLAWNHAGFPAMAGAAESSRQPQVYGNAAGEPVPEMAKVTHWRRPEQLYEGIQPKLFKNDWEVEGIVQCPSLDNRWMMSALNIVAGNREQLDRMFMCDMQYADKGFFVLKFYRDDPMSDDDWAVVIVDDRLPCDANGHPAGLKWPPPCLMTAPHLPPWTV